MVGYRGGLLDCTETVERHVCNGKFKWGGGACMAGGLSRAHFLPSPRFHPVPPSAMLACIRYWDASYWLRSLRTEWASEAPRNVPL